MAKSPSVEDLFEEVDRNQDGNIDKKELTDWMSKRRGYVSQTNESSTYGQHFEDNDSSRYDRIKYRETTISTSNVHDESVVTTNGSEETRRYLERSGMNVYIDPHPQLIRRKTSDRPLTYEQRVFIRCLQPPPLPPPEPLIIKEVRPEQPPPLPPLVIREQTSYAASVPQIVLRERPPTPPARHTGEIRTRCLSPVPLPPRSLIIERIPPPPEKPRDIIIERWLPYSSTTERPTIVHPAPPPIAYPPPSHTIIEYDGVQSSINRKFERLDTRRENPDEYISRYGANLLDSSELLRRARNLGITEDISCPQRLPSMVKRSFDADQLTSGSSYERVQRLSGTDVNNMNSGTYVVSTSRAIDDRSQANDARDIRSEYHRSEIVRSGRQSAHDSELI